MKKPSKESIAGACLIAYIVLFASSILLLSVAGDYVCWYATTAFALIPPILIGSTKQRALVCVFLVATLLLVMHDHQVGMSTRPARLSAELSKCQRELNALNRKTAEQDRTVTPPADKPHQ